MTERKVRQSNLELLRIVAMLFIVAHHFLIATGKLDYRTGVLRGGEFLNAFCVVGVNCFILISGYFGIKFRVSKILNLLFVIMSVLAVDFLLGMTGAEIFDSQYAMHTITPFVKGCNWFLPAYIALMFLAPVLNKAICNADGKELRMWAALLTIVNLYAYFCSVGSVNSNGYTIFQFIYLYITGACLRRVWHVSKIIAVGLYTGGAVAAWLVSQYVGAGYKAFAYNSPQVLVASVGFFMLFASLDIRSRLVNRAARAVFVVFLFHYIILKWLKNCDSTLIVAALYVSVFVAAGLLNEIISLLYNALCSVAARVRNRLCR